MNESYTNVFKDVNRVLIVVAHPDDLEVFAGGLAARLIREGKEIRSVKVTNGNKGSRNSIVNAFELAKVRKQEDLISMNILRIKNHNSFF